MNNQIIKFSILFYSLLATTSKCCSINDTHALILARGGSKGIRNKNIITFNGTSLLGRSIKTIRESNKFSSIWVSTDDENIAREAVKHGALVYKRMACFAQDRSTSIEAIKEFLYNKPFVRRFALFQCTSVFMKTQYIEEAANKFQHYPCVFAVKRSHKLRWKQLDQYGVTPLNFNPRHRPRRQDWNGELEETGMFYFSSRHLLTGQNILQNESCAVVEIDAQDSIEIDSMKDLKMAQCIINFDGNTPIQE